MNLFDKLCAVIAIPAGFIFIGMAVSSFLTSKPLNFHSSGLLLLIPLFFGWGMSITLIRFWLHSNGEKREAEDNDPLSSPFASDPRYRQFLHEHPEFLHAPRALRHHGFSNWISNRTA